MLYALSGIAGPVRVPFSSVSFSPAAAESLAMLTLHPTKPQPFRPDQARDQLLRLWEGLDLEGRRMVLAHARAVADMTGRAVAKDAERSAG
jgi:hypothetical protein